MLSRLTRLARPSLLRVVKPSFLPYRLPVACFHSFRALQNEKVPIGKLEGKPELMIAFTCKKCDSRSSHVMSKQAYTGGTVLIQCPSCKSRHLIADHLKIFSDDRITIEDILSAKGESATTSAEDLAFEDIPEKLKNKIGHHAKDAPAESSEVKGLEGGST